jgi:hypothetical protein
MKILYADDAGELGVRQTRAQNPSTFDPRVIDTGHKFFDRL